MAKARARHILVSTNYYRDRSSKKSAKDLKTQIEAGGDFARLSKRPFEPAHLSFGKQGGDLGEFGPGQMG